MITPEPHFLWLEHEAFNNYSQAGEDGVLRAIFTRIGSANQWCVECGAADGLLFSNTRQFIEMGWKAVLIEGDRFCFARLQGNSAGYGERVKCYEGTVDAGHRLDDILAHAGAPPDIDLAVIDVDGQEYYLWNAMLRYRPRVVVIEFDRNAADGEFIPQLGKPGQAGVEAVYRLGSGKQYQLVYRNHLNLIFVRHHLAGLLHGQPVQVAA